MPKFGLTMEQATVSQWLVAVGEKVDKGQVLAIIESEKVEMELPSPASGLVAEHLAAVGSTVPVGAELAVIVADDQELQSYGRK